jgi:hypothetical protein
VRIPNEPDEEPGGPFSQLLRLQTDFYTRLTEETLRYLRRLQGAAAPAVPGTVLMPGGEIELSASGSPDTSIELDLEVENRQRVHCVVTPMLSPMVGPTGVTWFPAAEATPPSLLLAPTEVATLLVKVPLPANIPPGAYHGALLLQGFREGTIAVTVTVIGEEEAAAEELDTEATATADEPPPKSETNQGDQEAEKKEAAAKSRQRKPRRQS